MILTASLTNAELIYNYDSTIDATSYKHVSFTILREINLKIEGISSDTIEFFAMDELNYKLWQDLQDTVFIKQNLLKGEYKLEILVDLPINSTLNLLFLNSGSEDVEISISIDEIVTKTKDTPLNIYSILGSIAFVLLTYRKSKRMS